MRIVDVVFSQRPVRDSLGVALAVALCIHGAVLVWAARAEPSLEAWAASVALSVHDDLAREDVVTLEPEQLPPPKKVIEEAPRSLEPAPAPEDAAPAAPAAEAANVITSDEVVDLSGDTVVKGNAVAPAGGTTRNEATPVVAQPKPATIDRSQKVTLAGGEWACPWPKTARAEIVDAQSVVIKVEVAASGEVLDARVVKDSAGGFGEAAIGCARKTRFQPALNLDGLPVRAWSPPIEVRFSR